MSSMRSASSSTSQRVSLSLSLRSSIRSLRRPGVATTTSTPLAIFWTWAWRDTPPSTSTVESRMPTGELAQHLVDLHREFAGRREDQRPRGHRVRHGRVSSAMPARIGRPKAAVLPEPVWAMPMMSRPCKLGRDGLGLDRGRDGETRPSSSAATMLRGKAEFGKVLCQTIGLLSWRAPDQCGARVARRDLARAVQIMQWRDGRDHARGCVHARLQSAGPLRRSPHWSIRREVRRHS